MLYNGKNEPCVRKAPYQPGDVLYIRETWTEESEKYYYRADYDSDYLDPCETLSGGYPASCRNHPGCDGCMATSTRIHWRPSIHMPKEAARIWLKVKNVRVERLQEMKPVDVIKEGAYPDCWDCLNTYEESGSQCCYGTEEQCSQCDGVMMEWEKLWNSTIKKSDLDCYGWNANPWVWVIEFERCKKPKGEN